MSKEICPLGLLIVRCFNPKVSMIDILSRFILSAAHENGVFPEGKIGRNPYKLKYLISHINQIQRHSYMARRLDKASSMKSHHCSSIMILDVLTYISN